MRIVGKGGLVNKWGGISGEGKKFKKERVGGGVERKGL